MLSVITQLLVGIMCVISLSQADSCHDDPVALNEQFFGCCKGRPLYSSEFCVDTLLENSTFSQECLLDCMYKEFKIYDGETIDLAGVKTFLDSQIINEEFNLVYMNAFERCSKLDKSTIREVLRFVNHTNEYECDEYPHFVDICVWYYTVANCPDTYATDDETCSEQREWVKECLLEA